VLRAVPVKCHEVEMNDPFDPRLVIIQRHRSQLFRRAVALS
jgi:hypothetical protein